ncbi:hypothetical protein OJF2_30390 [Aquisphaera giovannonii]|uniref:Uncharacterized protein n=1 Tax=Aquisphaera giovannonii TaxID=406548 RepID=A0A5B9W3H8_9BACT|nr:hypothetical protein [Aquisphaera giovannonii]QEH34500.1 hypothetical protein OJF2_30390 [Aquisphaera giovannonii]
MHQKATTGAGTGLVALAFAIALSGATPQAHGDDGRPCAEGCKLQHAHHYRQAMPAAGTLGYGPPGIHPGFQGFGLGWHRGYGYGGRALGPGAEGGYPFYGGPGYPHPWPTLRRIGGINPFPHFIGPGGPTPTCPNFYGEPGQLRPDSPVVQIVGAPPEMGYGQFHGMLPYPDSTFAPFTAAASGEATGVGATPPAPEANSPNGLPTAPSPANTPPPSRP